MKIIISFVLFFWTGCSTLLPRQIDHKKQDEVKTIRIPKKRVVFANRVCKENGGIKFIYVLPDDTIECGNGAIFKK